MYGKSSAHIHKEANYTIKVFSVCVLPQPPSPAGSCPCPFPPAPVPSWTVEKNKTSYHHAMSQKDKLNISAELVFFDKKDKNQVNKRRDITDFELLC